MNFKNFLEYDFYSSEVTGVSLTVGHILLAVLTLIVARLLIYVLEKVLRRFLHTKKVDLGRQYAIIQFIKYIVFTIAILMALDQLGVKLSVIWGGAAALLVGIGLGLQQTFNDLVSGIIILIEGSIDVGDIVEVDGLVGTVSKIGLRTSRIETRDRISILVPNSKLVGENAINWSHNNEPTRFQIQVGVAYSSDVELVTSLLLQAVKEHQSILDQPAPSVQFRDFGSSSLDFVLHFFSYENFRIEFVKSDVRYRINRLFRQNEVEIPFPQQDLWLRNGEVLR